MGILWIILIGFIAGIIARLLSPRRNNPSGYILTTVLGIAGAFLATFIGQAIGWYRPDQGAGFIGATVGAVIVLFVDERWLIRFHRECSFLPPEAWSIRDLWKSRFLFRAAIWICKRGQDRGIADIAI